VKVSDKPVAISHFGARREAKYHLQSLLLLMNITDKEKEENLWNPTESDL
jgi:hypothetical protein